MQYNDGVCKTDYFALLPPELQYYILNYIPGQKLLMSAAVNQYWQLLANDKLVWKGRCAQFDYRLYIDAQFIAHTVLAMLNNSVQTYAINKLTYQICCFYQNFFGDEYFKAHRIDDLFELLALSSQQLMVQRAYKSYRYCQHFVTQYRGEGDQERFNNAWKFLPFFRIDLGQLEDPAYHFLISALKRKECAIHYLMLSISADIIQLQDKGKQLVTLIAENKLFLTVIDFKIISGVIFLEDMLKALVQSKQTLELLSLSDAAISKEALNNIVLLIRDGLVALVLDACHVLCRSEAQRWSNEPITEPRLDAAQNAPINEQRLVGAQPVVLTRHLSYAGWFMKECPGVKEEVLFEKYFVDNNVIEILCAQLKEFQARLMHLNWSGNFVNRLLLKTLLHVFIVGHVQLVSIKLHEKMMVAEGVLFLESIFHQSSNHLKKLNLSLCEVVSGGIVNVFSSAINQLRYLTLLDLSNNEIRTGGINIIIMKLKQNATPLKTLNLDKCKIQSIGFEIVVSYLYEACCQLEKLIVSNNLLDISDVLILGELIKNEKTCLKYLDLSDNMFGDFNSAALIDIFSESVHNIDSLILKRVGLKKQSGLAFGKLFRKKGLRLKILDLSDNALQDKGMQNAFQCYSADHHCCIEELYLDNNKIEFVGAQALGQAFQNGLVVKYLGLTGNRILDIGVEYIIKGLRDGGVPIKGLYLKNLGISGASVVSVLKFLLKEGLRLTRIDMSGNYIGELGVQNILYAVEKLSIEFITLNLRKNFLIGNHVGQRVDQYYWDHFNVTCLSEKDQVNESKIESKSLIEAVSGDPRVDYDVQILRDLMFSYFSCLNNTEKYYIDSEVLSSYLLRLSNHLGWDDLLELQVLMQILGRPIILVAVERRYYSYYIPRDYFLYNETPIYLQYNKNSFTLLTLREGLNVDIVMQSQVQRSGNVRPERRGVRLRMFRGLADRMRNIFFLPELNDCAHSLYGRSASELFFSVESHDVAEDGVSTESVRKTNASNGEIFADVSQLAVPRMRLR